MEGGVKEGGQGERIREMLSRAPVPERDTGKRTPASWEGLVYYVSHQTKKSEAKKQDKDTLTELSFSERELAVFLLIRTWDLWQATLRWDKDLNPNTGHVRR